MLISVFWIVGYLLVGFILAVVEKLIGTMAEDDMNSVAVIFIWPIWLFISLIIKSYKVIDNLVEDVADKVLFYGVGLLQRWWR